MRAAPIVGQKPRSTIPSGSKSVHMPLFGSATNQTINAITYEAQAVVTLAGAHAATLGGWANLTGQTGDWAAITGVYRIIAIISTTTFRIALDTSAMSAFTGTLGTFARNGIGDVYGSWPAKKVNGTTTNIFVTDRANGLTFFGDNYVVQTESEVSRMLDLRGFRGKLLIAADLNILKTSAPSASEFLFCLGRFDTSSGNGRAAGTLAVFLATTTAKMTANIRGSVATDADTPSNPGSPAVANSACAFGDGASTPARTGYGLCIEFGATSATFLHYLNGALDSVSSLALTGNDWPYPLDTAGGLTLFCKYGTSGIITGNALNGGTSGIRVKHLVIHRSEVGGMTRNDVNRFFADAYANGGSPDGSLLF